MNLTILMFRSAMLPSLQGQTVTSNTEGGSSGRFSAPLVSSAYDALYERGHRDLESITNPDQSRQSNVNFSAFDLTHKASVNFAGIGQCFLAEASFLTQMTYARAKLSADLLHDSSSLGYATKYITRPLIYGLVILGLINYVRKLNF